MSDSITENSGEVLRIESKMLQRPTGLFGFWNKIVAVSICIQRIDDDVSEMKVVDALDQGTVHFTCLLVEGNRRVAQKFSVTSIKDISFGIVWRKSGDAATSVPLFELSCDTRHKMQILLSYWRQYSNVVIAMDSAEIDIVLKPGVDSIWSTGKSVSIITEDVIVKSTSIQTKQTDNYSTEQRKAVIIIQSVVRMYLQRKRYLRTLRDITLVQSCVRRHQVRGLLAVEKYSKLAQKYQPHRTRVVMELYSTEVNYVTQLDQLVRLFLKPLRSLCGVQDSLSSSTGYSVDKVSSQPSLAPSSSSGNAPSPQHSHMSSLAKEMGIDPEIISTIFMNVEDIADKHKQFVNNFKSVIDGWDEYSCIGQLVGSFAEQLRLYSVYATGFQESKNTLVKCMKNAAFAQYVETVQQLKEVKRQDLSSLLILPIQRIPRYELLLKDFLKHTWTIHPDYVHLQQALVKVKDAAVRVNRAKAYHENKSKLQSLQAQLNSASTSMAFSQFNLSLSPDADSRRSEMLKGKAGGSMYLFGTNASAPAVGNMNNNNNNNNGNANGNKGKSNDQDILELKRVSSGSQYSGFLSNPTGTIGSTTTAATATNTVTDQKSSTITSGVSASQLEENYLGEGELVYYQPTQVPVVEIQKLKEEDSSQKNAQEKAQKEQPQETQLPLQSTPSSASLSQSKPQKLKKLRKSKSKEFKHQESKATSVNTVKMKPNIDIDDLLTAGDDDEFAMGNQNDTLHSPLSPRTELKLVPLQSFAFLFADSLVLTKRESHTKLTGQKLVKSKQARVRAETFKYQPILTINLCAAQFIEDIPYPQNGEIEDPLKRKEVRKQFIIIDENDVEYKFAAESVDQKARWAYDIKEALSRHKTRTFNTTNSTFSKVSASQDQAMFTIPDIAIDELSESASNSQNGSQSLRSTQNYSHYASIGNISVDARVDKTPRQSDALKPVSKSPPRRVSSAVELSSPTTSSQNGNDIDSTVFNVDKVKVLKKQATSISQFTAASAAPSSTQMK
ncbi:hypothetical protein MP228_003474 [Amoeboaphelidium protococcarum]|nr:hypothetical protein MP228_003474 [Amoeboaphelidium protococcarum]